MLSGMEESIKILLREKIICILINNIPCIALYNKHAPISVSK